MSSPGTWGPQTEGGRSHRSLRRGLLAAGSVVLVLVVAAVSTGYLLYREADDQVTRVPVDELDDPDDEDRLEDADGTDGLQAAETDARSFLVVGSDARPDDADDADDGLPTDDVEGQRSDAILYVSISDDRDAVSVVSLPRDLLVEYEGGPARLGDTFQGGAGDLVATVQREYGLSVHHYAKVTFGGFVDAVDTLGGVEVCLDEDLDDWRAGADLEAGCQRLDAEEALGFVRSRQGQRADLERIERQQRFLQATLDELTRRGLLTDVPRLFSLVEDVAGNVTTDDGLSLREMLGLADEARDIVDGGVPMTTVPAYPDTVGEREILRPYEPGARALFDDLRAGREIADRGSQEEREETSITVWTAGRSGGADIVASTLLFGGFVDRTPAGRGPAAVDPGATTTVYASDQDRAAADRVAALLGAPVRSLPADVELPRGIEVAVAVGRDAAGGVDLHDGRRDGEPSETERAEPAP